MLSDPPFPFQATCYDDTISVTPLEATEVSADRLTLPSQPREAATANSVTVAACINHVVVVKNNKVASTLQVDYEPLCVAMMPDGSSVAVGGKNKSIHVYAVEGDALKEKKVVEASGSVECLAYSPCGKFLGSGDGGRNVYVWDAADDYSRKMGRWKYHNSKVVSIAWTSDSKHIAT